MEYEELRRKVWDSYRNGNSADSLMAKAMILQFDILSPEGDKRLKKVWKDGAYCIEEEEVAE